MSAAGDGSTEPHMDSIKSLSLRQVLICHFSCKSGLFTLKRWKYFSRRFLIIKLYSKVSGNTFALRSRLRRLEYEIPLPGMREFYCSNLSYFLILFLRTKENPAAVYTSGSGTFMF